MKEVDIDKVIVPIFVRIGFNDTSQIPIKSGRYLSNFSSSKGGKVMVQMITDINKYINDIVWGLPMMVLILGVGVYLSVRCGFIQFTKFGHIMKNTLGKAFEKTEQKEGAVSPFKAM